MHLQRIPYLSLQAQRGRPHLSLPLYPVLLSCLLWSLPHFFCQFFEDAVFLPISRAFGHAAPPQDFSSFVDLSFVPPQRSLLNEVPLLSPHLITPSPWFVNIYLFACWFVSDLPSPADKELQEGRDLVCLFTIVVSPAPRTMPGLQ